MSEYDDELISPKSKIIMLQKEISELKRKSDPLNKSKSISTQKTSTSIQNKYSKTVPNKLKSTSSFTATAETQQEASLFITYEISKTI
ncbi:unnamed protein product [Rhizophagus irregularis]|uniref:Uncharacterized protein n=1 Tax=Rhizophagus irregularis TaxID=588596 RepID=A0A915ZR37_9GLOM|nr:unnamed protein product [Rhizophagus irregularis]CAB5376731.1 unnamed protein product [Rhizophagus irregularis]CAB5384496.1 unnamed protein product [Rhizophagus irregularis]